MHYVPMRVRSKINASVIQQTDAVPLAKKTSWVYRFKRWLNGKRQTKGCQPYCNRV